MYTFLLIVFLFVAFLQTVVILLQSSKGGGLAGAFGGGGGMNAAFGSRGTATFLSKLTTGLAAAFMIIALILGLMKSNSVERKSLVSEERDVRTSSPASIGVPVVPEATDQILTPPPQPAQSAGEQQE